MKRDPIIHAHELLEDFIAEYRSAAIPTLVLTAVGWACEHGGADVMRGTLRNALEMCDDMEAKIKSMVQ